MSDHEELARLRAVNAEMLEALKAFVAMWVDTSNARRRAVIEQARAAIAAAERRSA